MSKRSSFGARVWCMLKSEHGDSMVEVLASILIALLATTLLATMVMAASSVAVTSKSRLTDVYAAENSMKYDQGYNTVFVLMVDGERYLSEVKAYVYTDERNQIGMFARYEPRYNIGQQ